MANPWLSIDLADYEGHMSAPSVGQLEVLSDLFEEVLRYCRPESVAVLGVAGGNGLDRIDTADTKRVVGVDIHPRYLEAARERYADLPLTLVCADLGEPLSGLAPVAMVHAALVFEHAGAEQCLRNALTLVAAGGYLSVVLQVRLAAVAADVAETPFVAMRALSSHFRAVDRTWLTGAVEAAGLGLVREAVRELQGGKAFWSGVFVRG